MCEISGENAGWVDESPTVFERPVRFFGINVKCVRSLVKMLAGVDESTTVFERPVRSCVGVGHDPNWN